MCVNFQHDDKIFKSKKCLLIVKLCCEFRPLHGIFNETTFWSIQLVSALSTMFYIYAVHKWYDTIAIATLIVYFLLNKMLGTVLMVLQMRLD